MFLMIDNYDSFVYNLVHYFEELDATIQVYRNDAITVDFIKSMNPEGIIISPGPKDPTETGISEAVIRTFAGKIPILGVCLGHQAIAHVFGAEIIEAPKPMHGKISSVTHNGNDLFDRIPSPINVTRYHSLIVNEPTLPEKLVVTARSDDGFIMGLKHADYIIEGVQFHPEAVLTEYGHELLHNFILQCRQFKDKQHDEF